MRWNISKTWAGKKMGKHMHFWDFHLDWPQVQVTYTTLHHFTPGVRIHGAVPKTYAASGNRPQVTFNHDVQRRRVDQVKYTHVVCTCIHRDTYKYYKYIHVSVYPVGVDYRMTAECTPLSIKTRIFPWAALCVALDLVSMKRQWNMYEFMIWFWFRAWVSCFVIEIKYHNFFSWGLSPRNLGKMFIWLLSFQCTHQLAVGFPSFKSPVVRQDAHADGLGGGVWRVKVRRSSSWNIAQRRPKEGRKECGVGKEKLMAVSKDLDGWFNGDDFWFLRFWWDETYWCTCQSDEMEMNYYFRFCGTLNQWTVDVQLWHPVERGYCITICRLLYIPEGYEIPQPHGGAMKGDELTRGSEQTVWALSNH